VCLASPDTGKGLGGYQYVRWLWDSACDAGAMHCVQVARRAPITVCGHSHRVYARPLDWRHALALNHAWRRARCGDSTATACMGHVCMLACTSRQALCLPAAAKLSYVLLLHAAL
jgi:hypothetical protein